MKADSKSKEAEIDRVQLIKLVEAIFYSPETSAQANNSIMTGVENIIDWHTQQSAADRKRIKRLEAALLIIQDWCHYKHVQIHGCANDICEIALTK